jgi:hypothetical protein
MIGKWKNKAVPNASQAAITDEATNYAASGLILSLSLGKRKVARRAG